ALLPPASSSPGLALLAAEHDSRCAPVSPEPVKASASTPGCRARASPATGPSPGTTLSTPGGSPASTAVRASSSADSDDCSAGLSTTELPVAIAGATFQAAMISG